MRVLDNVDPTPEQLKLILDCQPGFALIRGAASGKTTTAVLRLRHVTNKGLRQREESDERWPPGSRSCSGSSSTRASTGRVPMPAHGESQVGGHAVLAVGYDEDARRFLVRNSWGTGWGQAGYFTMPYAYLLNSDLADDLWTIRSVE
jgi:hypothetical protein